MIHEGIVCKSSTVRCKPKRGYPKEGSHGQILETNNLWTVDNKKKSIKEETSDTKEKITNDKTSKKQA